MTLWRKREIMEMAREAGDATTDARGRETFVFDCYGLEAFAELVRANNPPQSSMAWQEEFEAFAELVRADERNRTWTPEHWTEYERSIAAIEREACANICESYTDKSDSDHEAHGYTCAYAIRARGNI
jgi:hypothetical protein